MKTPRDYAADMAAFARIEAVMGERSVIAARIAVLLEQHPEAFTALFALAFYIEARQQETARVGRELMAANADAGDDGKGAG